MSRLINLAVYCCVAIGVFIAAVTSILLYLAWQKSYKVKFYFIGFSITPPAKNPEVIQNLCPSTIAPMEAAAVDDATDSATITKEVSDAATISSKSSGKKVKR